MKNLITKLDPRLVYLLLSLAALAAAASAGTAPTGWTIP